MRQRERPTTTSRSVGPGQRLDDGTEDEVRDASRDRHLGEIQVHTGGSADAVFGAMHAKTFTLGHGVVFAEGRYRPDTAAGQELLAHEFVHVVQPRDDPRTPNQSPNGGGRGRSVAAERRCLARHRSLHERRDRLRVGGEIVTAVADPDGDAIEHANCRCRTCMRSEPFAVPACQRGAQSPPRARKVPGSMSSSPTRRRRHRRATRRAGAVRHRDRPATKK